MGDQVAMTFHICHLTVLNPSTHTRIFYKLALSQQKLGYKVSVVGHDLSPNPYENSSVQIIPFKPFHRLSFRRFFHSYRLWRICNKLQAQVYVIHSPELIPLAIWLKTTQKAQLIYDVHEDYAANIRQAVHYPTWLRKPLAKIIRSLEKWAVRHLAGVAYAEGLYDNVLNASSNQKIVLRNTFSPTSIEDISNEGTPPQPYLLYTGTIAMEWGIFDGLELWKKIRSKHPISFVIAGSCHASQLIDEILSWVKANDMEADFKLIGGTNYVPYGQIVNLIQNCWALTALYHLTPNLQGKIPTKFYEAMAFDRPLIYTQDIHWDQMNEEVKLGFPYQDDQDISALVKGINLWNENPPKHQPASFSWESDESRMKDWLDKIIKNEL